ncbi:MAG TPA: phosphatidate cytidylyltransferase [Steroidobacteraceae bacterium]|nr:phosphatidate cytidylyltransferase [Steroidobacteraceae bacterium]
MLKTRIITAAVLAAVLIAVILLLPPLATIIAVTAITLLGAWEWSAFLRLSGRVGRVLYVLAIAVSLPLVWWLTDTTAAARVVLLIAVAWWLLALGWVILAPHRASSWSAALAGLLALAPAWLALMRIRLDLPDGAQWLLFLLILVWVADIGAFFFGRRFGRVRLAPDVSPGKTWEGVVGGVAMSALVALAGSRWFGVAPAVFVPLCLAAVAFSVVGDLTESLLKRFAGVKDSGTLFPGHGGVMDRIDSLTGAAPVLLVGLFVLGIVR